MKNIAKCRLCSSIIESLHHSDYVMCKCGQIAVDGGNALLCYAKDWENFIRIDDEGNEIIVKVESKFNSTENQSTDIQEEANKKPTKKELIQMLKDMIKAVDNLPQAAMSSPINHYDHSSLLILLLAFFTDDCSSVN